MAENKLRVAVPMIPTSGDGADVLIIDPNDINAINVECDDDGYETYIMFKNGDRYETKLTVSDLLELLGWLDIEDPQDCLGRYIDAE